MLINHICHPCIDSYLPVTIHDFPMNSLFLVTVSDCPNAPRRRLGDLSRLSHRYDVRCSPVLYDIVVASRLLFPQIFGAFAQKCAHSLRA